MSGVHFIDGQYYVEVKRDAKIGDLVTREGVLRTVTKIDEKYDVVEFDSYVDGEDDWVCGWGAGSYKTLEPLDSDEVATVDTTQASEAVIDMLANLARRVTQLESQLRATQRNLETFAEQTESNTHDIITLDERTQVVNAINKFYERGER